MTREIEFRGYDESIGLWRYGSLLVDGWLTYICQIIQGKIVRWRVNPQSVGEFTGLRDKNDKKVFEGDILLWIRKNVYIDGRPIQDFSDKCIIYYDNNKCGFRFRCKLDCGSCIGNLVFSDDRSKESYIEVIGNIYDNKELLNNE